MSIEYYKNWWGRVLKRLEDVERRDHESRAGHVSTKDKQAANRILGGLYCRYCTVVQEMAECLDQLCQVQKNEAAKRLLDAAESRLNEIKDEFVKLDLSEYHYFDQNLIELKLEPHDVEVLHPMYMHPRLWEVEDLVKKVRNGETVYTPPRPPPPEEAEAKKAAKKQKLDPLAALLAAGTQNVKVQHSDKQQEAKREPSMVATEPSAPSSIAESGKSPEEDEKKKKREKRRRPRAFIQEAPVMTPEEVAAKELRTKILAAIILIQKHERLRQCRLYFNDFSADFLSRKEASQMRMSKTLQIELDPEVIRAATTKIQSTFKGYKTRKLMERKENERRALIKMIGEEWTTDEEQQKYERNLERRREIKQARLRDFMKAVADEKKRLEKDMAPRLFEDIGDELRDYLKEWYTECRIIREIPTEEQGGSKKIVRGEVETIGEYLMALEKKNKQKKKSKEQIAREQAKEKEQLKKLEEAKKKEEAQKKEKEKRKQRKGEYELVFAETPGSTRYAEAKIKNDKLHEAIKDINNPLDKPYMDIITDKFCLDIQYKMREQVDEVIRMELVLLKAALERDKGRKPKKAKKPKKKKRKGQKGKKDPTGKRCLEDLVQELVDAGIIHNYPKARIEDFRGDFSYNNWDRRMHNYDPPPTLGDIRTAIIANCILPLGAEVLIRPKSVLITGPRQSGKHLLANAIFNETKCVLFDLSPKIINSVKDKYHGAKGNKTLVHLVTKVAKLLSPSVVYVDGGEKPFYKKVPKEEKELNPKRVGKLLPKIVKDIKQTDRVLVLAVSGQPWSAQFGKMKKNYHKIFLIPPPDYNNVFLYWRELLEPYKGVDRNLELTPLTTLTVNYPLSELKRAVEKVLVPKRVIQLSYNPLKPQELLNALLAGPGKITQKEFAKFQKFYRKTPLGKARTLLNATLAALRDRESKAKSRK